MADDPLYVLVWGPKPTHRKPPEEAGLALQQGKAYIYNIYLINAERDRLGWGADWGWGESSLVCPVLPCPALPWHSFCFQRWEVIGYWLLDSPFPAREGLVYILVPMYVGR